MDGQMKKTFMVRFGCVVPSFWQPALAVNPAPGHDPCGKKFEKQLKLVVTKRDGRKQY